jgi:ABC-type phosphate transport system ATPase subunit
MLHSSYPLVLGPEHSTNTTSRSNAVIIRRQVMDKTVSSETSSKYIKMVFQHLNKFENSIKQKTKFKKKQFLETGHETKICVLNPLMLIDL